MGKIGNWISYNYTTACEKKKKKTTYLEMGWK